MKKATKKYHFQKTFLLLSIFILIVNLVIAGKPASTGEFTIDEGTSFFVNDNTWEKAPKGGDTIFVLSERTRALKFQHINGKKNNPIVVINKGGLVNIDGSNSWGAITFENCSYIKISGRGHADYKYGFVLSAKSCGLAFSELSTDCEAENIYIDHDGFFGIYAKKDYGGNPPNPAPVFSNLVIHDCFVQNVTEGMYLGETKSPGMEFKHVRIYNNIVKNTGREAIQIANMVEDVKIYNNTLLNTGLDGKLYQNNILQIGDNSVCEVYNNILIGAESNGIISMGMGNNSFTNNFIASNNGIFMDNRTISNKNGNIIISGNYFYDIKRSSVIKNMNEINSIEIKKNTWNNNIELFENASGNKDNYSLTDNKLRHIESIAFANPDVNNYALAEGTPSEYEDMGAPGGLFTIGKQETEPVSYSYQKIELTHEMIIDEVEGGSYHSPAYLVDEQNCSPENELHPVSESWKPHWNMDKAPYHIYIDLGQEYQLTNIALHDMHNVKNLGISVGEPGNWQHLFTEPCDNYNTWKEHSVNATSRYIRLSMNESVYAAVNEIIVYGKSVSGASEQKSAPLSSSLTTYAQDIQKYQPELKLYPNPAINEIKVELPVEIQNDNDFAVEIFDAYGQMVYSQNSRTGYQSELSIDLTNSHFTNGTYYLRYSSENGSSRTAKFVKHSL